MFTITTTKSTQESCNLFHLWIARKIALRTLNHMADSSISSSHMGSLFHFYFQLKTLFKLDNEKINKTKLPQINKSFFISFLFVIKQKLSSLWNNGRKFITFDCTKLTTEMKLYLIFEYNKNDVRLMVCVCVQRKKKKKRETMGLTLVCVEIILYSSV